MGGGGRAARALRLLFLLVMALAAVEYLFGSILDASSLKGYLYTPVYNATQPTLNTRDKSSDSWPKRLAATVAETKRLSASVAEKIASEENTERAQNLKNKTVLSTVLLKFKENQTTSTKQAFQNESKINVSKALEVKVTTPKNVENVTKIRVVESKSIITTTEANRWCGISNTTEFPLCDETPPNLGPITANKSEMSLEWVETKYPQVSPGGMYKPMNCTARHKVAIIVAYRDRAQHLALFLNHMHPFLMKQQLEYGIFIVEQLGRNAFNRAKLFNVGFAESQKLHPGGWQCFIFHDVDLLPIDERNMYTCPRQPRHMSAAVDKHKFRLLYDDLFGGVSALTLEQFTKVNGFSNKYWGWGGEDDDMSYRVKKCGYHIARYKMSIARYVMLDHKKASPNPKRYTLLSQTNKNLKNDGLSTLNYDVVKVEKHHLYTLIKANIDEGS